jgi:hypothetical protein
MPKHYKDVPDLTLVEGVVSDKILRAAHAASSAYTKLGIRHALVGGLAVGAYGYARATKDVDFVVGDEAFITCLSGSRPIVDVGRRGALERDFGRISDAPVSPASRCRGRP